MHEYEYWAELFQTDVTPEMRGIPPIKYALEGIENMKRENRYMGFVLYMIAIRMFTYGESFETAAGQVRNETPN